MDPMRNLVPNVQELDYLDVTLRNLLKRNQELEEQRAADEHEQQQLAQRVKQLEARNALLVENNEKMSSQLERQKEFVVFPLTKLPDDVILDIVEKLKRKHRRHLMQSCSHFRQLLLGKKADHVDCRISANFFAKCRPVGRWLKLFLEVEKGNGGRLHQDLTWTISPSYSQLPVELTDIIRELSENFHTEKVVINMGHLPFAPVLLPTIRSFVDQFAKYHPTEMVSTGDRPHARQVLCVLLDCSQPISLSMKLLSRHATQHSSAFRRQRKEVEKIVQVTAASIRIPVAFDESGPDNEYVVCLKVDRDNGKSVIIRG